MGEGSGWGVCVVGTLPVAAGLEPVFRQAPFLSLEEAGIFRQLAKASPPHACKHSSFQPQGSLLSPRTWCDLNSILNKLPRLQNLPAPPSPGTPKEIQEGDCRRRVSFPFARDFGLGGTQVLGRSLVFLAFVCLESCETWLCSLVNSIVGSMLRLSHSLENAV